MNFWLTVLANPDIDLEENHLYLECSWIRFSTTCESHAVPGTEGLREHKGGEELTQVLCSVLAMAVVHTDT